MPQWLSSKAQVSSRKIVYLVSGVGTLSSCPKGPSGEDLSMDNSTLPASEITKLLIEQVYPGVEVYCIHSPTNVFRYDENIVFVNRDLVPRINRVRDKIAARLNDWKKHLFLTLSFANGSSARVSAINACMRNYRPSYMHFWQLKRFWRERRICNDDIEIHSFEEIATIPAVPVSMTRHLEAKQMVQEMINFRAEFHRLKDAQNDLGTFWMRKTKKPVLSVLMVRKFSEGGPPEGEVRLIRGTNMEVSMPTGSLCAERSAIGSALGSDLTLRRRDIIGVAVLGVLLSPDKTQELPLCQEVPSLSSSPSSGATSFDQRFPDLGFVQRDGAGAGVGVEDAYTNGATTTPATRSDSDVGLSLHDDSVEGRGVGSRKGSGDSDGLSPRPPPLPLPDSSSPSRVDYRVLREMSEIERKLSCSTGNLSEMSPVRDGYGARFNGSTSVTDTDTGTGTEASRARKGSIVGKVAVAPGDRNPLKPCGTCLEWLKKIAEVNPRFFVVTFTDEACSGMYVEEIDSTE